MSLFLCARCKSVMCEDCISIAEEYQMLEQNRKQALVVANDKVEKLQLECDKWKRRAEMFEDVAKAGVGDIISAWMDNNFARLLKEG